VQHLLGSGANPQVFGEIGPAHDAVRVDQEFGRSRDGLLAMTLRMQHPVAADDLGLLVGQERIGVTLLAAVIARDLRWIDADGHRPDSARRKFAQVPFDTPQLGVAGGSPIPTVKNEQDPFRRSAILRRGQKLR
jgi:hypothetical protein